MKDTVEIRATVLDDAEAILDIYKYYVLNTAITFEYEVPSLEEFRSRIENTLRKYPYLVAVKDDAILGYAYAGAFIGRAAYDWSAELTIYLAPDARKRGLGRRLYEALELELSKMGILNLYACIGYPEVEDEYLDKNSAKFHEHLGFVKAGEFHKCGYKFNRWYNMIWMEKIIGEHKTEPKKVLRIGESEAVEVLQMTVQNAECEKIITETERLIIREMRQFDLDALCRIMCDEEVMRAAYESAFSVEEVQGWLNRHLKRYEDYGFGLWAVVLKETNEMIGQCGLTLQSWGEKEILEIGYLFQKAYWHKGYATEAVGACKEYAFSVINASSVYSMIRDTNIASQNVAVRNGMKIIDKFTKNFRCVDMNFFLYSADRPDKADIK